MSPFESLQESLTELFAFAVAGKLRVAIGGRFPLARVAEAHRALESRTTKGKLVLVP